MTKKTRELLLKCKQAGYEKVTIFIRNPQVPLSMRLKNGFWFGFFTPKAPYKVICGHPEQIGMVEGKGDKDHPKMWEIVKQCGLTAGLKFGGLGTGDAHEITPYLIETLTAGYYELSDLSP